MENLEKIQEILQKQSLRKTPARQSVLAFFLKQKYAIAHSTLEKELSDSFDRVTLYRTLASFEEKGIIHKIMDDSGIVKYALCTSCDAQHHHDEHVHFQCSICKNTYCLSHTSITAPKLPEGFQLESIQLLVSGICPECA
jgi:Fur family ferric uptake transcriptional regulator